MGPRGKSGGGGDWRDGAVLAKRRLGLTNADLAKTLGVSESTVSRIFSGHNRERDRIEALSEALDIDPPAEAHYPVQADYDEIVRLCAELSQTDPWLYRQLTGWLRTYVGTRGRLLALMGAEMPPAD